MARMRRLCPAAAAVLAAALLLCGCARVDIAAGVDAQNSAYLSYHVTLQYSGLYLEQQQDVERAVQTLAAHYRTSLGFEVAEDYPGGRCTLEMKKAVACGSLPQAFDALAGLLTDEGTTPFMRVQADLFEVEHQTGYRLRAELDFSAVLGSAGEGQLPPELGTLLNKAVSGGAGSVTLSLPASQIERAGEKGTLSGGMATAVTAFGFDAPAAVELDARLDTGALLAGDAEAAAGTLRGLSYTAWAVAGCALAAAAVCLLLLARRRARRGGGAPPGE